MEPLLISLILGFGISECLESRKSDQTRKKAQTKEDSFERDLLFPEGESNQK